MIDGLDHLTKLGLDVVKVSKQKVRQTYQVDEKLFRVYFNEQKLQTKAVICYLLNLTEQNQHQIDCLHDIVLDSRSLLQHYTFTALSQPGM